MATDKSIYLNIYVNNNRIGIKDVPNNNLIVQKLNRYGIELKPVAESSYKIRLQFHCSSDLNKLGNDLRRDIEEISPFHITYNDQDIQYFPIIHITEVDLLNEDEVLHYVPRFKKYLDSSIWHYYLPIHKFNKNLNEWSSEEFTYFDNQQQEHTIPSIQNRFHKIIESIQKNYNNSLYSLSNTIEYVEVNNRLLRNSYLSQQAHGQHVAPFIFHSEQEFDEILRQQLKQKDFCFHAKWRILLIDDHADKCLGCIDNQNPKESKSPTKLEIVVKDILSIAPQEKIVYCCPTQEEISKIQKNLDNHQKNPHILNWKIINNACVKDNNFNIAIICVEDIDNAEVLLQYAKFDIVLLDYLLGNNAVKKCREYSYELLNKIADKVKQTNVSLNKDCKKTPWIGPLGRLYFMYISAFVTAISERLQEQSLIRDTNYWHIGRGACPTNTPQLFLYYLYRLMEKRYSEMVFDEAEGIYVHTLIDLLDVIFISEPGKIKGNATKYFNTLLNLRRKYDLMKNDIYPDEFSNKDWLNRRGSLLVYTLFPDIQYYSNSFWEHIQQLIYLTAYGTIRQWPEMWEEYIFVRESLKKAETDIKERREKRIDDKGDMPSVQIEKYIIQLKNA